MRFVPVNSVLCERSREWISLRLDGELSELAEKMLESHLARCAACRTFESDVEVTSRLGSGTTFTVTLPSDPRREHGPDGTAPEPLGPIEESPDRGKMVDSSPTARPSLNGETSV